jgi:hypothetical protein
MHFLGTSKLEWAVLLTDVQRAVRKYVNPNFTISFDCASPFLASANGQIYIQTEIEEASKWVYRMVPSVDDKKYATDTRRFSDGVLQDKVFENFTDSPISKRCTMNDICVYKPGDLNKINKEGKTSWDSFSYAIQMGHNVWSHLTSVQEANRQYDIGVKPAMMSATTADKKTPRDYNGINDFRDIVDMIFSLDNKSDALELIEHYNKYWMAIIGTRGAIGKKTTNSSTMFNNLFDTGADEEEIVINDDVILDEDKLDKLELEE